MYAFLRHVDGGQKSEDRERPAVIQVAMKGLQVGLRETLGQRPVGVQGRERGRAAEVTLRKVEKLVLRRKFQQVRARPKIKIAVAGVVLIARHASDRGGLALRTAGGVADHERR